MSPLVSALLFDKNLQSGCRREEPSEQLPSDGAPAPDTQQQRMRRSASMGLPPKSPASRLRALEGEDPLGTLERLKRGFRLRQTYSLPLSSGCGPYINSSSHSKSSRDAWQCRAGCA